MSVVALGAEAPSASDHVAHFYSSEAELVERVGDYLAAGLLAGEVAIVVAKNRHRWALEAHLRSAGVDLAAARGSGRFVSVDAASQLAQLTPAGRIDHDVFHRVAVPLIRSATETGLPVRAYGEMVALLWEGGDVVSAIELEELWNELRQELPFALACGYAAASVSEPGQADALRRVCELHSSVFPPEVNTRPGRADPGTTPDSEVTRSFPSSLDAPRTARWFAVEALEEWGYARDLVSDAALVLTELAANAVVHTRSPSFSVTLRSEPTGLRLVVADGDTALPESRSVETGAISGRGMGLVASLATSWGCVISDDGKIIWAEFRVS